MGIPYHSPYTGRQVDNAVGQVLAMALSVKDPLFGCVGDGVADDRTNFQLAMETAAANKRLLLIPDGKYRIVIPSDEDVGLTCEFTSDGVSFGELTLEGTHTGDRLSRLDVDPPEFYSRGVQLIFEDEDDDLDGKVCFETGLITSKVVLRNITFIGDGRAVGSIGLRHNVSSTKFYVEECTLQHFGTGIDVGGDYVENGDTHADFNSFYKLSISECDIGVDFKNFQGCVNTLFDCSITARICVRNIKSRDTLTQSPPVNVIDGFYQPLTEYNCYMLVGTIASVVGSVITLDTDTAGVPELTKKWKFRNPASPGSVTLESGVGTMADITAGMFVLMEKNCALNGSTRVPEWENINFVTSTTSTTVTVSGTVDTTELAGKRIWIFIPAIAFDDGGGMRISGIRSEATEADDVEFGPILLRAYGWGAGTSLSNSHVKLYGKGDFNRHLPKIIHQAPVYGMHSNPVMIDRNTLEIRFPKIQCNGLTSGFKSFQNVWPLGDPVFIDANGAIAEGVIREMDSHTSKMWSDYGAWGGEEYQSHLLHMGKERFEQRDGLLYRPISFASTAPTFGYTGSVTVVAAGNNPTVYYRVGAAASINGYYRTTAPIGTATISLTNPTKVIMTDVKFLYRDHVISIVGAGPTANSGLLTVGQTYMIVSRTDGVFTAVGAANNNVGTVFVATGTGVGLLDAGDTVSVPLSVRILHFFGNAADDEIGFYISAPASTAVSGVAVTTVAPVISASGQFEVLRIFGGAGGVSLQNWVRSDTGQDFSMHLSSNHLTLKDVTSNRDVWAWPSGDIRISAEVASGLRFKEAASNPTAALLTSGSNAKDRMLVYMKSDKLVIAYNNAGTVTYISIPMDGATTAWTHSTTAP